MRPLLHSPSSSLSRGQVGKWTELVVQHKYTWTKSLKSDQHVIMELYVTKVVGEWWPGIARCSSFPPH